MKKINEKYILSLLILAAVLLGFVGCSDMMEKLGNISLHIELDNHDVSVASYTLEGTLANSSVKFTPAVPDTLKVNLSSLKSGRWTLTVKAFDSGNIQIGIGTQVIELKEGQVVDTTLLVVFTQPPPVPTSFMLSSPTRYDSTDGKMAGTTAQMEYKLASSGDDVPYVTCTESETVLASGTYLVRYASTHGFEASEPISLTVPVYAPIQLTVTAPFLTTSRIYDGTVDVEGNVTVGTLIGVQGTDEVTVSGTATYADKHAGTGKIITVTYTLGGADAVNYIKPVDTNVTGVIEKKELTVLGTEITSSKVYDGLPFALVTDNGTLIGKVSGDVVTVGASASYSDRNAGTVKPVTITYTLGGADAGNYQVNDDVSKTANITKATYDMSGISFSNITKVYDGNAQSLQISGILPSGVTVVYIGNAQTNAGNYSVTARFTGDSVNYHAIADKSADLTITKATMTGTVSISGIARYSEILTVNTNLTNAGTPTYQWKRGGVAITGATDTTYTLVSADIGTTISVTVTAGGDNYQGSRDSIATSNVERKELTVSGTTVASFKVYDGLLSALVSEEGTLVGKMSGDAVTVTANATYVEASVGTGKPIVVTYILSGADAGNYLVNADVSKTANITKAALIATVEDSSKTYGEVNPTFAVSVTGFVNGETSSAADGYISPTASSGATTTSSADTTFPISISGGSATNYSFDTNDTGVLSIEKKGLTVSIMVSGKVYDGNTNGSGFLFLNGKVGSDDVGATGTFTFTDPNAGNIKAVEVMGMTLTGTKASNYSLAQTSGWGSVSISRKSLTVSATADAKVYDGTTAATGSLSLSGIVGSDEVSATGTFAFADANAGSSKIVNVTGITLSGAKASNYSVPATSETVATISKASMSGSVSISGTAKTGQVLAANTNLLNAGVSEYQWKRGGLVISGATATTYTLVAADIGSTITVTVSADEINYTGSRTSAPTAIVLDGNKPAAPSEAIEAHYPTSPADQDIINLTSFTVNATGLEATVSFNNGSSYSSYVDLAVDSRGRAYMDLTSNANTTTIVKIRVKATENKVSGVDKVVAVTGEPLSIGDYYQGGVVAYLFAPSDTGYVADQSHGLIASKSDLSTASSGFKWSDNVTLEVGTEVGIGTGLANTNKIITVLGASSSSCAAGIARSYRGGDYTDWFLPSWLELRKLGDNRTQIGNFVTTYSAAYWSSSESSIQIYDSRYTAAKTAHVHLFDGQNVNWVYDKPAALYVRAVRYF